MKEIINKAIAEIKKKLNRDARLYRSTSQGDILCWVESASEIDEIDEFKVALIQQMAEQQPQKQQNEKQLQEHVEAYFTQEIITVGDFQWNSSDNWSNQEYSVSISKQSYFKGDDILRKICNPQRKQRNNMMIMLVQMACNAASLSWQMFLQRQIIINTSWRDIFITTKDKLNGINLDFTNGILINAKKASNSELQQEETAAIIHLARLFNCLKKEISESNNYWVKNQFGESNQLIISMMNSLCSDMEHSLIERFELLKLRMIHILTTSVLLHHNLETHIQEQFQQQQGFNSRAYFQKYRLDFDYSQAESISKQCLQGLQQVNSFFQRKNGIFLGNSDTILELQMSSSGSVINNSEQITNTKKNPSETSAQQNIDSDEINTEETAILNIKLDNLLKLASIAIFCERRYKAAEDYLLMALELNSHDIDIILLFVSISIQRRAESSNYFLSAVLSALNSMIKDSWWTCYLSGWILNRLEQHQKSFDYLNRARQIGENTPQSYLQSQHKNINSRLALIQSLEVLILMQQKKNMKAQSLDYAASFNNLNSNPNVFLWIARVQQELKAENGETYLNQAKQFDRLSPEIPFYKANSCILSESYEKAAELFRECISLEPLFIQAYLNRAFCLAECGNQSEQKQCLLDALKIQPTNYMIYVQLGQCYQESGELNLAEEAWKQAILFEPQETEAYACLGFFSDEQDKIYQSLWCYRKYIEKSKKIQDKQQQLLENIKNSYYSISALCLNQQDYEEAEVNALSFAGFKNSLPQEVNTLMEMLFEEWNPLEENVNPAQ